MFFWNIVSKILFYVLFRNKEWLQNKVFIFTTFALFSDGKRSIDLFNDAYEKGPRRGSDSAQNAESDTAEERDLICYDD